MAGWRDSRLCEQEDEGGGSTGGTWAGLGRWGREGVPGGAELGYGAEDYYYYYYY